MFDHVALGVADPAPYVPLLRVLGHEPSSQSDEIVEWEDFDILPAGPERPATRGVHVGFVAPDLETIERFWRTGLVSRVVSSCAVIGPDGRSWWSAMNGGIPGVCGRSSPDSRGEQTA